MGSTRGNVSHAETSPINEITSEAAECKQISHYETTNFSADVSLTTHEVIIKMEEEIGKLQQVLGVSAQ